jgi:hypothetical protein
MKTSREQADFHPLGVTGSRQVSLTKLPCLAWGLPVVPVFTFPGGLDPEIGPSAKGACDREKELRRMLLP